MFERKPKTKNAMEKDKPWNDQNIPIEKNGSKLFFIVITAVLVVIYFGLMVVAYYKNN
jgi:hypothetical protein